MTTRAQLMRRLAAIPQQELLELLEDKAIFDLAAKYSAANKQGILAKDKAIIHEPRPIVPIAEAVKAKRPLNAFMAFRCYYLRLFPEAQQKTASGFLTALWQHEPFRNRWTLIAKVYSFIRDEVGKQKVSLPYFLGICCPIMKIISPISYLHFFGWTVEGNEKEGQKLVRQWTPTDNQIEGIQSQSYPNTEMDLLRTMLSLGYLPDESMMLMERMRSNSNGVMDTGSGCSRFPVPFNAQKMDYINTVREDPIQAAQELFGIHYNDATVRIHGYRVYDVESLDDISHLSMIIPTASPTSLYHYTGTYAHLGYSGDPTMPFFQQPEHQNLSVSNPIQMESFIGHPAEEGDRTAGLPGGPQYSPEHDFHYMY
jgi:hypothetical protein